MSVNVAWQELVSAALVGTDRRMPTMPSVAGVLGDALSSVDSGGSPAGSVLDAAALLTGHRRAGVLPITGLAQPESAPAEDRPEAPAVATRRLAGLLDGGRYSPWIGESPFRSRIDLLPEWLSLASDRGLRAPAELLPALLDLARAESALRLAVVKVGGHRAVWLAGQHREWRYLLDTAAHSTDSPDPAIWETGSPGQRAGYLAALRRSDPDAAGQLLADTWTKEPAEDRARFLGLLQDGLAAADEPFCERALDDRSQRVRETASRLLAQLPGSALRRRMAARAVGLVQVRRAAPRVSLAVTPPDSCDEAMRRDGIAVKPPPGTGERAWWLEQVIARTALDTWTSEVGGGPAEIVALPVVGDFGPVWRRGLVGATADQQDPRWAAALLESGTVHSELGESPDQPPYADLYRVLPAEDRVRHAVRMLRGATSFSQSLLESCPVPWPDELAHAVLDALGRTSEEPAQRRLIADIAGLAAARLPHHAAPADQPTASVLLTDLYHVLRLRAALTKEFE
ncbi:MAG TPA: DUF5691 domain-containing protein [Micromonosporaceae bacterium]|nr:DUF5691 domain-containing protein [Micromonosporaceae bacterium]